MIANTPQAWGSVARFLHWAMALLIIAMIALGWTAKTYPLSPTKLQLFIWHKSIGLTLLALVLIRLMWRATNVIPAPPYDMPKGERVLSSLSHGALYILMMMMPVSGYVINSTSDFSFRFFGWRRVPNLIPPDETWQSAAQVVHLATSWALVFMVIVHVAAALRHHLVRGDDVLARMLPSRAGPSAASQR